MAENLDLARRVAKLELQNRRWRSAVLLAAIGVAACLALGAASRPRARLIEATEFRLVDQKGTVRGAIAVGRGGASISLNNGAGRTRAALVVGEDGAPRLDLLDRSDAARASMRLSGDGTPELTLSDAAKNARGRLRLGADGSPRLDLADDSQKAGVSIAVGGAEGESAPPASQNKPRAWISVRSDGCPSVKLLDEDGSTRASLGCTALKEAGSGSSANTEPSSLVLIDRKGRVVFKAPK